MQKGLNQDEFLTPGQMKSLAARFANAIPTNISFNQAEFVLQNPSHVSNMVEEFFHGIYHKFVLPKKFVMTHDLGIITVPAGFDHTNLPEPFGCRFLNPTRVLKSGDKLWVRVFGNRTRARITFEERLMFLNIQKAFLVGAQGAVLVFEQKCEGLPQGNWCASFDNMDRLWHDTKGNYGVPRVSVDTDGTPSFDIGRLGFEGLWLADCYFLCFTEVKKPDDTAHHDLTLSKDIDDKLAAAAHDLGISVNQLIINFLEEAVSEVRS